jgi:hypothetical protein
LSAACDEHDNVLIVERGNTWRCRVDVAQVDAGGRYEIRCAARARPPAARGRTIQTGIARTCRRPILSNWSKS